MTYIPLACFTVHFIMSIFIAKMGKIEDLGKNKVNFGELKTSWMILVIMFFVVCSLSKMNNLHPQKLNEYPYNLLVFNNHFGLCALLVFALVLLFYAKSKNKMLRTELKTILCPNNSSSIKPE